MDEHRQALSEHIITVVNRLEQVRLKTGMTWAEVAGALGVSRTQLHLIRKRQYEPNKRVLLMLEQVEVNAGLRKPPGDREGILRLLEAIPTNRQSIEESDHDAGVVEVPVEYRRGSVPEGLPQKVPVKAPDASVAAKLLVDLLLEEDLEAYLQHCLPPQFASQEFLNRIEPASFLRLLDAALEMSLGAEWRSRLRGLSQQVGNNPGAMITPSLTVAKILGSCAGALGGSSVQSRPDQKPQDGERDASNT